MDRNQGSIVVMGVSGCGKSTVGRLLAARLGIPFHDADDFHPESNVRKMAAGKPLNDTDRWPWLGVLAALLADNEKAGSSVVLACSALKVSYRRALAAEGAAIRFVYLKGGPEVIGARLEARHGHFMPTSLMASQFDALEPPRNAIAVSIDQPIDMIVQEIEAAL